METVYLAGPIGDVSIEEANKWREIITLILKYLGFECLNPLRGITEENRTTLSDYDIVERRNKTDISQSDIMLVYWPERKVSNGTAMEILEAFYEGIPVLFVGEWAENDIWIRYHVTDIFKSTWDALVYISRLKETLHLRKEN